MRAAVAILSVLVLAVPAPAQIKGPSDVTVAVGRLAAVPLTIDGDESDYVVLGSDVDAFREYTTDPKQLRLRVIGYAPGTAYVTVAAVKGGKLQPLFVVKITVTGTPAPPPVPPGPTPTPPGPTPVPVDPPIAGEGLRMLIVRESADLSSLPSGQVQAMTSADVRAYLQKTCPKGPDGRTPEFRVYDKDQDLAGESATWRAAFARATKKMSKVPWIAVSNGHDGFEGPLPESADALLALLKKYGG